MKKLVLLGFAIGLMCTANAQNTATKYDANEEMQEQMRLIANTLGLDQNGIIQLGQIMDEKKQAKDKALAEIEALKQKMSGLEATAEKQLQGMLTKAQWEKYNAEVKPKVKAVSEAHMKTID